MRLLPIILAVLLLTIIVAGAVVPLAQNGPPTWRHIRPASSTAEAMFQKSIPGGEKLPPGDYFVRIDRITGKAHIIIGRGLPIDGFTHVDSRSAEAAAFAFIAANEALTGVAAADLSVQSVNWERDRAFVHIIQTGGGAPVWGGNLNLIITPDAKVSLYRSDLLPDMPEAIAPAIDEETALSLAPNHIKPGVEPNRIDRIGLFRYPAWGSEGYETFTVWAFQIYTKSPLGLWQVIIDAASGETVSFSNELRTVDLGGTIMGQYHYQFKDDPLETAPWRHVKINIGSSDCYSDIDGVWTLTTTAASPWNYQTSHYGRYCDVDNGAATDASYSTSFSSTPFNFTWTTSTNPVDEMNLYYHVNRIHDYVRDTLGFGGMNYRMSAQCNDPAVADNAYYDGYGGINFGAGGTMFYDLSLFCDIVYHEYTHGVTHHIYPYGTLPYSGQSGAMDEGFSDYFPCSMTDNPWMGDGGLFRSGTAYMRRCNTAKRYPESWVGEVHADAEIIDAAWWGIREGIGRMAADSLIHLTRFTLAEDFEDFFWATLATDDDDGDITNGTPNARLIYDSYFAHGIGPGFQLTVVHTPLSDTEQTTGDYDIRAEFVATLGIVDDSAKVFFRIDGGDWMATPLTLLFGIYRGDIPAQPYGTLVDYFIYSLDNGGYQISSPPGAPMAFHSFAVEIDTTPPSIIALPIGQWFEYAWPPTLYATVHDDHGLALVEIHGELGGVSLTPTTMSESDSVDIWTGPLPGIPAGGDTIQYWIVATDVAISPHTTVFPSTGTYSTRVLPGYNEDIEVMGRGLHTYGIRAGYANQWDIGPNNNPYSVGSHCYQFTGPGGTYADESDGALCTPELRIGNPATLTFWHRMSAETDGSHAGYAWDGGVVEVSTDGGASWGYVDPTPGYTHRIQNNPASPFAYNTWCFSGDIWWRQETIDMAPFYPGAMIRFHFGSDSHVYEDGWFIDDIVLTTVLDDIDESEPGQIPRELSIEGCYPNPFNAAVKIRVQGVEDSRVRVEIFDINGRMVYEMPVEAGSKPACAGGSRTIPFEITWQPDESLGSGVYLVRLLSGDISVSSKVILMK